MSKSEPIVLKEEQETLFVPLLGKASYQHIFPDEKANSIITSIPYDFKALKVPKKTATTLVIRAKKLDEMTEKFIKNNPEGIILHLGCGLDSRCIRVKHPLNSWFDLDFPEVIDLRRKFFTATTQYQMIGSSVTDLNWLNQIPLKQVPYFVIAEGLFMYLHEQNIIELFQALEHRFTHIEIAFDAFSEFTVKNISKHPSIQKTGASIRWGIDNPMDIEKWDNDYTLMEEWYFTQSPLIDKFGLFYRLMFNLTSHIDVANKAQRILHFRL
jgi:O-methyltransferase involved in polyketide biosynthesis